LLVPAWLTGITRPRRAAQEGAPHRPLPLARPPWRLGAGTLCTLPFAGVPAVVLRRIHHSRHFRCRRTQPPTNRPPRGAHLHLAIPRHQQLLVPVAAKLAKRIPR